MKNTILILTALILLACTDTQSNDNDIFADIFTDTAVSPTDTHQDNNTVATTDNGDTMGNPTDTMGNPTDTMDNPTDTMGNPTDTMDNPTDTADQPVDTGEVVGDECNSTAQCQAIYGAYATDCVDSASDQSYCQCGQVRCAEGNPPLDTAVVDTTPVDTTPITGATGVYIEVESINPVSPWVEETSISGYSGASYFSWPDVASNANGITNNQNAALAYHFEVGQQGTYLFEVRGRRDHEGWCVDAANDACNDIFTKIDSGNWTKKMIKGTWGQWIWDGKWEPGSSVITTEVDLSAGAHTYSLSGRSNGVKIDAIRIYLKGTTPPAP